MFDLTPAQKFLYGLIANPEIALRLKHWWEQVLILDAASREHKVIYARYEYEQSGDLNRCLIFTGGEKLMPVNLECCN